MSTFSSKLTSYCYFRADGVQCQDGYLHYTVEPHGLVMVEGEAVSCPACEGKALVLTDAGKDMMTFLETFARPYLREMVETILQEKKQR